MVGHCQNKPEMVQLVAAQLALFLPLVHENKMKLRARELLDCIRDDEDTSAKFAQTQADDVDLVLEIDTEGGGEGDLDSWAAKGQGRSQIQFYY